MRLWKFLGFVRNRGVEIILGFVHFRVKVLPLKIRNVKIRVRIFFGSTRKIFGLTKKFSG